MKIIILLENSALPGLEAEHGLSLYIETGPHRILFDMGQSGAFARNAEALGVDLETVDFGVISHGHYDHGGGLEEFFCRNSHAPVYASRHILEGHYNRQGKDIGLPPSLGGHPRLRFVGKGQVLAPGIELCTLDVPPVDNGGMFTLEAGLPVPEDFRHEQYLRIREGGQTVLISGCSHKGIAQIAEQFRPDILVGGFHLMKTEDPRILRQTAGSLLRLPTRYATGHCTGREQFAVLQALMGSRVEYWPAGTVARL